jgi:hypothetical protein
MRKLLACLLPAALLGLPLFVLADDGAASIAEGGIVIMKRETRITMAKEVLQISNSKVIVDYEFRNDTDQDVVTVVAFPIATYTLGLEQVDPDKQGFDDFRLWIDEKPFKFEIECRAYLKGRDETALLKSMKVDVGTFGHANSDHQYPDVERLSVEQRRRLESSGLLDKEDDSPMWEVRKKYYWTQTFPAHSPVRVRHAYSPVVGALNSIKYGWGASGDAESAKELGTFCIEGGLKQALDKVVGDKHRNAWYEYVDFILTTANTWKTPIEDFTLVVQRPHQKDDLADYVSFCWNGPVTKTDPDHFVATATNFVPNKELRVGFFHVVNEEDFK